MRCLLLVVLVCLLASRLEAAILVVQHKTGFVGSANQASVSVTVAATNANNLVVVSSTSAALVNNFSSCSDNAAGGSSTYAVVASTFAVDTSGSAGSSIFCSSQHVKGSVTSVTVNFSPNVDFPDAEVWEVSGFTTPVIDVVNIVNNGASSSTPFGASVTTTASAGFIAAVIAPANSITAGGNPHSGNAFTSGGDISGNNSGAVSLISASAAAHQPQWDQSPAGTFAASTAAWKESSGTVCAPTMTLLGVSSCGDQ